MLLCWREDRLLDEESRRAARDFGEALQAIVADDAGPSELRASLWLTLVAYAAERVCGGEWAADDSRVALTREAAGAADSVGGRG
jgi:hypothetical protein